MGAEVGSTANSYRVLAKLAVGGMAEIFLARGANATGVERYVVLKRIMRDKATDTRFVQMFLEEARLAAQLQHANIAQVYDIGKLGDSYFFTMEYVHGETVRTLLEKCSAKRREIPVHAVLSVLVGTAAGLQHAHERIGIGGQPLDIVHRDVSPSNLIMSYEGIVKLVDFGVAKATTSSSQTRVGTVKGKAAYMSPEQTRSEVLDRRSDLFSLGIVAWEMLTTRRLFTGKTEFETMSAIVRNDVEPPSYYRGDIPREVDDIVLRLLAKSPNDRYQCGDDVVEACEAVATKLGLQLSAKSLSRYVREVFGNRAEPWVELAADAGLEAVSVTSEPIPANIAAALSVSDMALDGLHESTERDAAMPSITPTPPLSRALQPPLQPPLDETDELDAPTIAVGSGQREITGDDVLALVPTLPPRRMQTSPIVDPSTPVSGSPAVGFVAPDAPYNKTVLGVTPRASTPSQPMPLAQPHPSTPSQPMPQVHFRASTPSQPMPLQPRGGNPSQPMPLAQPPAGNPSQPMPLAQPRPSRPSQPQPLAYGSLPPSQPQSLAYGSLPPSQPLTPPQLPPLPSHPPVLMPPMPTPPTVTFRASTPRPEADVVTKQGPRPLMFVMLGLAVIAAAVTAFLLVR